MFLEERGQIGVVRCVQEPVDEPAGVCVGRGAERSGSGAAVDGPVRAATPPCARACRPTPLAFSVSLTHSRTYSHSSSYLFKHWNIVHAPTPRLKTKTVFCPRSVF